MECSAPLLISGMDSITSTLAVQFDYLGSLLGVAVTIAASFAVITLVASYFRFQRIVEEADKADEPGSLGASSFDVLRVQIARFLNGCARKGTSFCVALIRIEDEDFTVQPDSPFIHAIRKSARDADVTYYYDDKTAVLLAESEPDDASAILTRVLADLRDECGVEEGVLRAGVSTYPGHALNGMELLRIASEALDQTSEEEPIHLSEVVDVEEEGEDGEDEREDLVEVDVAEETADETADESDVEDDAEPDEDEEDEKGSRRRGRSAVLDELTGVLKPTAVSAYMQRLMSELRRNKRKVALFCIGINNIDHIKRIHGEQAGNDIMAGVSQLLQDNLRADDLIGRHEQYAFMVLAEASSEQAEMIGKRICNLIQHIPIESGTRQLKTSVSIGAATYPENGRNLHHLYTAAQKVLDYGRENDIRAYAVYNPQTHDKIKTQPKKSLRSRT